MRSPFRRLSFAAALLVVAGLGAAACGDDGESTSSTSGSSTPTVSGAWARTSPAMATAGAAYMEIKGGSTDDALLAASAPTDIAATTEVHETTMAGSGSTMNHGNMSGSAGMATTTMAMGSGSTGSGMMEMRKVEKIAIPAGKTVSLAPGGYHVMLLGLPKPLVAGQKFTLTLTFEKAGKVDVPVEVRAS
jgi:copper(I)-binding protein